MDSPSQCKICHKAKFKYTCPKCNIIYCSLNCYRAPIHQQCSETFYKSCVVEEMVAHTVPNSGQKFPINDGDIERMHAILRRLESAGDEDNSDDHEPLVEEDLDSDDEGAETDLASRLEGINLDDTDAVWKRLNLNEQHEFEALLRTGEIENLLPAFYPWWEIKIPSKLIEVVDSETICVKLEHPQPIENIPSFESLIKRPPSRCLPNNLYNILAAYTCTVRFFNGEHHLNAYESVKCLASNSATLKNNANFDDKEQAVKSVILECENNISSWEYIAADVENIIEGPYGRKPDTVYVIAALSDIYRLADVAKTVLKKMKSSSSVVGGTNNDLDRRKLNQILKKIEFFLAFVYSTGTFYNEATQELQQNVLKG